MIVCFALQADTDGSSLKRAAITIESVRKHIPDAKIIQMANDEFPAVEGVDEVVRRKNDGDFIRWAFSSLIGLIERGENVLQIATDIVLNGDVSDVFKEEFDVASCRYPLVDRADGAFCGDINFIKPSGLAFWRAVLDCYNNTPSIQDGWEGGQTAFLKVSKEMPVKELDYHTYCWTPWNPEIIPEWVKIAHFRGWRKSFMEMAYKLKRHTVIMCVDDGSEKASEYVQVLHDMVNRNLGVSFPYKFIYYTNKDVSFDGIQTRKMDEFINKSYQFEQGTRIIQLDVTNCVVCGLDNLTTYEGLPLKTDDNSVLVWFFGEESQFSRFEDTFPDFFHQYTPDMADIPKNARIISFKGGILPHEVKDSWVEHVWRIGGGSVIEYKIVGNVSDEFMTNNVINAMSLPYVNIADMQEENGLQLCIVGGGPSLADCIGEIQARAANGAIIWALNNSIKYLREHGVIAHAQIMLDAREKNVEFVPEDAQTALLYASTCHASVFSKAEKSGSDIMIWHPSIKGILDVLGSRKAVVIGCGNSVGLKAMGLAMVMGFRDVHLYGYDSSYRGKENHAYKQPLNDGESIKEVQVNGVKFLAAAWMALQAEEFKETAKDLVENHGMSFTIHGDGLLPYIASLLWSGSDKAAA